MRVVAPGKLVLSGAYAVLEGAPAVVVAIDRYARAAVRTPDEVDVSQLHDPDGRKLGLGSSAASIVATLGARALARGEDVQGSSARRALFLTARESHARSQGGGSGVDVAAAVYGGVLHCVGGAGELAVRPIALPAGLVWAAFFSGTSARTSDLLGRVNALRLRDPGTLSALRPIAERAVAALDAADTHAFVSAARDYGIGLAALGRSANAPIVPPAFAELASLAEADQGAFLPSGAGGGDVGVWLGTAPPPDAFAARALSLSMSRLKLGIDSGGVRPEAPVPD